MEQLDQDSGGRLGGSYVSAVLVTTRAQEELIGKKAIKRWLLPRVLPFNCESTSCFQCGAWLWAYKFDVGKNIGGEGG